MRSLLLLGLLVFDLAAAQDPRPSVFPVIPGRFPPLPAPDYMVDHTRNGHGNAPDKGTLNGPVVSDAQQQNLTSHKGTGNLTSLQIPPDETGNLTTRQSGDYWLADITHGRMPFQPSGYQFYRNVKDFGAVGDGVTDDTIAINNAAASGNRCGLSCGSTTISGALVYFPPGTYLISSPIIQYYYTQFVGNPNNRATIKGSSTFSGIALVDTDVYIPGGNGSEWYINQNQFYRQIRNLVFDLTAMPETNQDGDQSYVPTGLHWQVAQATSLQNLGFIMKDATQVHTAAVGIFMENGSGGFMSDITFFGGNIGFRAGSQQFTARNLQFVNCGVAISMIWDWGFTWKNLQIINCFVAIDCTLFGAGPDAQGTGSIVLLDSQFINVPFAIPVNPQFLPSLVIDNLNLINSQFVVFVTGGTNYLIVDPGEVNVGSWAMGEQYGNAGTGHYSIGFQPIMPSKSPTLLDSGGHYFVRSKPQYEHLSAGNFIVATANGIANDATGDQSGAINSLLAAHVGTPIFFPAGVYLVQNTVNVPAGSVLVGEGWSQIMGTGSFFQDESNPHVMVRFGNPGDKGSLEISDFLFTVRGPTAGAVLVEWNIGQSSQGSAAMWDCHFRVGGAIGSNLQLANCPKLSGTINSACKAASLLLHVTSGASGYFENVWVWVADHDIDEPPSGPDTGGAQIDIYSARGVLIESRSGPVWLYGTASEHNAFYQYQLAGTSNIYSGHMQTETPYWQPNPGPFEVFKPGAFSNDPDYSGCGPDRTCQTAWALRVLNSTDVFVYGAGFYNFFDSYSQACLDTESCQQRIIETSFSQRLWMYDLYTKGSVQVVSPEGGILPPALQADDNVQHGFTTEVAAWLSLAQQGANFGLGTNGGSGSIVYVDPQIWNESHPTADCQPPCVIVLPPKPLSTNTTITFPPYSTSLTETCNGVQTIVTTTITIAPLTTDEIDYWNINITTLPTTIVAESSIQAPPFLITESCNGLITTFYPRPYPYITSSATLNNPTVTVSSGPPSPTCTSHCGHHCDIFCVGPCLLCIPCLFCGGGPPPPIGGGDGDDDECSTTTTSTCNTFIITTPTPTVTSTCVSILACSSTPTNGITAAAPGFTLQWENWGLYDGNTAADSSEASLASIAIVSQFGTGVLTSATPSPTRTLAIWALIDAVEGIAADSWAAQPGPIVDTPGPGNVCRLNDGTQETPQPENESHPDNIPASWAFKSPIYGMNGCTFTATQTASDSNGARPTGTLLCPGLPSAVACPPIPSPTELSCFFQDDIEDQNPLVSCVF